MSKYTRRRGVKHRRNKSKKNRRRTYRNKRRNRRKQYGGKGKGGYLTMDHRYRPVGGLLDGLEYETAKFFNNLAGNYKTVNPNPSNQPIGDALKVSKLKFGAGSRNRVEKIFRQANVEARKN